MKFLQNTRLLLLGKMSTIFAKYSATFYRLFLPEIEPLLHEI